MGTLTLNDGTVLNNSHALLSSDSLFIYVQQEGTTINSLFALVSDPGKTDKIVYTDVNGENVVFKKYKRLTAVSDEGNGLFTAVLKK